MATYYGIIKINEKKHIHFTDVKRGKVFIGSPKSTTNPSFFLESDDLAERCVVKVTEGGSYIVDWVILDKSTDKESKKTFLFNEVRDVKEWLSSTYFVKVKEFFTEGAPTSYDIRLYTKFLLNQKEIETPIINI